MTYFSENLEKYAALAVNIGVNIQKGQTLVISAPISAIEFVRMVAKKAYESGASDVVFEWSDDELVKMKYDLAPGDTFKHFPNYRKVMREELAEKNAAFLSIISSNPDLLSGVDQEKISDANKAAGIAMENFRKYILSDKLSWSIVAVPNEAWAQKVFPYVSEKDAVEKLWNAIFTATRANASNPVEMWKKHVETLDEKASFLNKESFKSLHYTAPGTDLTIDLPEGHIWVSAGSNNQVGTQFIANMPTEEVFTTPHKTGVNGVVAATKPLSYAGNLIENFSFTFKDGKIIDFSAEKGYEALKKLIETDEGSHFLGEVALVPHNSPISNTDLIFFNTLFDENASNHLAIGSSYAFTLKGGKEMNKEELEAHGLNDSLTHVDFMIGSDKMDIVGVTESGEKKQIFKNGNWAF